MATLTIALFGREILYVSTDSPTPEPEYDTARDLSGGTTSAYPIGFVPHMDKPHEMDTPDRD